MIKRVVIEKKLWGAKRDDEHRLFIKDCKNGWISIDLKDASKGCDAPTLEQLKALYANGNCGHCWKVYNFDTVADFLEQTYCIGDTILRSEMPHLSRMNQNDYYTFTEVEPHEVALVHNGYIFNKKIKVADLSRITEKEFRKMC